MQYSVWAKQYIVKDTWCIYQTRMCIIDICINYKNWLTDFSWKCPTDPDWEGEGGGTQQTCVQEGFVLRSNPTPLPFEIPFWTENMYSFCIPSWELCKLSLKYELIITKTEYFLNLFTYHKMHPPAPLALSNL